MLVLTRKVGEEVEIGDGIRVRVARVVGNRVSLAFEAPREVKIHRLSSGAATEPVSADSPTLRNPHPIGETNTAEPVTELDRLATPVACV